MEICVDSVESAVNAVDGGRRNYNNFEFFIWAFGRMSNYGNLGMLPSFLGADRIELCASLQEGGLTPSIG